MTEETRRLIDLAPGDSFQDLIFAFSHPFVREAKNATLFLSVLLSDCTGERKAKQWNASYDILERLKGHSLIKSSGFVERNGRFSGEIRLTYIEPHPVPEDITPFLRPLPQDHAAHKARFDDIIRAVKNPHLKALLREVFQGDFASRFYVAPAGKMMHHAYRGGLLEHTGEVALMCERVASVLPHINRDLLLTAALLHDIGKLEEMEMDFNECEYTPAGQLVGHVVLGTCLVTNAIAKIPDFPNTLKYELMHLILSHHGEPEYGAARRPMCAEALILSQCDLLSAKIAQCYDAASSPEANLFPTVKEWHSAPKAAQNYVYTGLLRESMESNS